jgi:hypothetical protein
LVLRVTNDRGLEKTCTPHKILLDDQIKYGIGQSQYSWNSRNAYNILVGKPEGKRPLGRCRLDGIIKLKWISKEWGERCGLE